jgi:hypothetical protein
MQKAKLKQARLILPFAFLIFHSHLCQ